MHHPQISPVADCLVLAGLGCLVASVLSPRHLFLLDLLVHARRDKRAGWGESHLKGTP